MSLLTEWVTSVAAASLLSCAALSLCPAGRERSVTRLVCGLVCAIAVAGPLARLNLESLSAGMAAYEHEARAIVEETEQEEKMLERTYIEEECAAYILAKATETGAAVSGASVLARWDDDLLAWYPWEAAIDGAYSETLSRAIEAELGVPAERQKWSGG